MNTYQGYSDIAASTVLENADGNSQSLFEYEFIKKDDPLDTRTMYGLCHHIPGFQGLLQDCRDILVFGQSLKFFRFVEENPISDSRSIRQYVQLTYWDMETQ